jgi:hypothetical protein
LERPQERQIAALRTREAKNYEITPDMLQWRERARTVGLDRELLEGALDRQRYRRRTHESWPR